MKLSGERPQHEGQGKPPQTPQEFTAQMQVKKANAIMRLLMVIGLIPNRQKGQQNRKN